MRAPRLVAVGLALGSFLILGAVPVLRVSAERAADPGPALAPGVLLVAAPRVRDPDFRQTVVLLASRDGGGSAGLVLDVPPPAVDPPLPVWGGPLSRHLELWVTRAVTPLARTLPVPGGLTVSRSAWGVAGARRFRGVAGWGPGDLAREVRRGAWVVVPGGAATVLTADPAGLWARLAGGVLRRFAVR